MVFLEMDEAVDESDSVVSSGLIRFVLDETERGDDEDDEDEVEDCSDLLLLFLFILKEKII
jgi:hypothetical protein